MSTLLNNDTIRQMERASIHAFLQANQPRFRDANVLDYGCGQQPYRDLIERAGGDYHGYDREEFGGNVSREDIGGDDVLREDWDVIVTTQTIQYVPPWEVAWWLGGLRSALFVRRGVLLMTGPTTWPLVESADWCRYTPSGIRELLTLAGFEDVDVEVRGEFTAGSVPLNTGWQAVAKAKA